MDSLTQAALGAAVGHVVAGERGGSKALVAGAVAGTLPDLDVLFYPVLDSVAELGFHRGLSHSFLFVVVAAPLFGLLVARFARGAPVSWKTWSWVGFWAFGTHVILDSLTIYGTGLLEPFSNARAAWNTLFIIDPLYTVPLLVGLIGAMLVGPGSRRSVMWTRVALGVSVVYLIWAGISKTIANREFEREFARMGIDPIRYISTPTPFNTVLWRALAETESEYVEIYYSVANDDPPSEPNFIPKHHDLLSSRFQSRASQTATWFSQGYYSVTLEDDVVLVHDLRFGQVGFRGGPFVLSLALVPDADTDGGWALEQRWFRMANVGPVMRELIDFAL